MLDAHLMQQGGVEVVLGDDVLNGAVSEVVGGAVDVAGLEPAAGHPDAEALGVVVAPGLASDAAILHDRQAAHFSAPLHDR